MYIYEEVRALTDVEVEIGHPNPKGGKRKASTIKIDLEIPDAEELVDITSGDSETKPVDREKQLIARCVTKVTGIVNGEKQELPSEAQLDAVKNDPFLRQPVVIKIGEMCSPSDFKSRASKS
ncbi:MAG: hypothetical protein AAF512_00720 [Pseudomonadota bacterium]